MGKGGLSLAAFIYRWYAWVLKLCRVKIGWDRADDAVQEVFLRLSKSPRAKEESFPENEKQAKGWLAKVVRSVIANTVRYEGKRKHEQLKAGIKAAPEGDLIDDREALEQILCQIPKEYAEAWRLKGEGLSYAEIGKALGVPAGTVGVWICRARERMSLKLAQYEIRKGRKRG